MLLHGLPPQGAWLDADGSAVPTPALASVRARAGDDKVARLDQPGDHVAATDDVRGHGGSYPAVGDRAHDDDESDASLA